MTGPTRLLLVSLLFFSTPSLWGQGRPSLEEHFDLAAFRAYLGETFAVYGGRGARWVERLTLIRIEDLSRPADPVEQFRLVLLGKADSTLKKDSYHAEHPEAGRFRLFLAPGPVIGDTREFYIDFQLLKKDGAVK